nr:Hypothetical protein [Raoultella ornithinolytica]
MPSGEPPAQTGGAWHAVGATQFKLAKRIQQFLTRYFSVLGNGTINHPDTYLKNRFSNSDTNNSDHVHVMLLPDQWSQ